MAGGIVAALLAGGSLVMAQCGGSVEPEPIYHVPFAWATYALSAGGGQWEYRSAIEDAQHKIPVGWQHEWKTDWQVNNCVEATGRKYSIFNNATITLQVFAICRGQGPGVPFQLPNH